jgi:hypothetical protein
VHAGASVVAEFKPALQNTKPQGGPREELEISTENAAIAQRAGAPM